MFCVPIHRLDQTLPLPLYSSKGAVAFDLYAREETIIEPQEIGLVPGNIIVEIPEGYALFLAPRSSLPRKKALIFPHSIGIVDQDFCGPEDEIMMQVYNIGKDPVTIERGERIAQGVFVKMERAQWKEVAQVNAATRGGFGSTG
ncbi:dUTPase [Candidatus Peribacteria bacterium RIFCSPHIGHO2_02_FULL_49_16]|nr:MAG: dUTPase [Candidatus Peribacteria bacterium RIFCSPHIGHO2_01_FULL_49_38]OGJ58488.1 MAG: dUTPase [Candidatus Peribacteria bacterium RIFCSPHIGHO2_02_FULL_49_16]